MPSNSVKPQASMFNQVKTLLMREQVLGLITYVASVPDRAGNALLGLTLLTCAVLWSACDGVLPKVGRLRSGIIFVEGLLLYVGAVAVANILILAVENYRLSSEHTSFLTSA